MKHGHCVFLKRSSHPLLPAYPHAGQSGSTVAALFQVEQPLFAPEAAAVAAEFAAFGDDVVAGDEDGDPVPVVGGADGASRTLGADPFPNFS